MTKTNLIVIKIGNWYFRKFQGFNAPERNQLVPNPMNATHYAHQDNARNDITNLKLDSDARIVRINFVEEIITD